MHLVNSFKQVLMVGLDIGPCALEPRENTPNFKVFLWFLPCILHVLQGSNAGCSWDIFRLLYVFSRHLRQLSFTLWCHKNCVSMKPQKLNFRTLGSEACNKRPLLAPYLVSYTRIIAKWYGEQLLIWLKAASNNSSLTIYLHTFHAYYLGKYLL